MEKFDLVVIGSGPAGFAAASKALDFKKNVCIVEANHLGGTGVMNGALTSKTMWELSRDYAVAASVDRGYRASGLVVDYDAVRRTVLNAAKKKQYQMLSQIETYSKPDINQGSLCLKYGYARFVDKSMLLVENNGQKEWIQGKDFIIATGSRPRTYPGIEIDGERIITSDSILNLKEFPQRLMIIGSGIIGCEFATIFSNFKQTEVHLLDRAHRVLPFEDDDVSEFVSRNLENNGVIIHHTANLRTIRKRATYLEVILDYDDGHSQVIEVDVALISIGRVPNTDNLGLDKVGIYPNEKGFLSINQFCMLSDNPDKCHIFAAGDITGHGQLYSVGEHQGRFAVEGIYNQVVYSSDYSSMSTLMFFKPEVAAVGMNEKMLQKQKIKYRSVYYSNALVNRAIAMCNTDGFVKIMVSDDSENKILGMRAAGPQASALIVSVAHLINHGNSVQDVLKVIHPHPSVSEGIQECLRVLCNESVFKPRAFPDYIKLKHWAPE